MSEAQRSSPNAQRPTLKKSGVVIPNAPKWHQRLAALILYIVLRALYFTLRTRLSGRTEFFLPNAPAPVIFCLWHNRLATCMKLWGELRRPNNGGVGLGALVSASKDGAFLARALEWFQVQPVRGSSSRRGAQAMRELTTWAALGHDLAITPDGPRGPCYQAQDGVIALAQLTGHPIVPVALNLNWKISLKSWDKFQIPLPFARWEVCTGNPVHVPKNATADERQEFRRQLESELRTITRD